MTSDGLERVPQAGTNTVLEAYNLLSRGIANGKSLEITT